MTVAFGTLVTKQRPDWPELFGMASQEISSKIPDHPFREHIVSRSGGIGKRLRPGIPTFNLEEGVVIELHSTLLLRHIDIRKTLHAYLTELVPK